MYDRSKSIGASDAVLISEGQWAELYDRKLSGDSLSGVLPAAIGHATEALNRQWFTQETGIAVLYDEDWTQAPMRHPDLEWCVYLPDGLIDAVPKLKTPIYKIPFEAKAVNPFWKPHRLRAKYNPQLQHAMRVMDADHARLSVFYLNQRWEEYRIEYDPIFDAELLEQERLFMWFLENQTRPPE